jgi:hypothetical protein
MKLTGAREALRGHAKDGWRGKLASPHERKGSSGSSLPGPPRKSSRDALGATEKGATGGATRRCAGRYPSQTAAPPRHLPPRETKPRRTRQAVPIGKDEGTEPPRAALASSWPRGGRLQASTRRRVVQGPACALSRALVSQDQGTLVTPVARPRQGKLQYARPGLRTTRPVGLTKQAPPKLRTPHAVL